MHSVPQFFPSPSSSHCPSSASYSIHLQCLNEILVITIMKQIICFTPDNGHCPKWSLALIAEVFQRYCQGGMCVCVCARAWVGGWTEARRRVRSPSSRLLSLSVTLISFLSRYLYCCSIWNWMDVEVSALGQHRHIVCSRAPRVCMINDHSAGNLLRPIMWDLPISPWLH